MIIYGTRHFGAVDEVPGLGCVKTRFFHIWFIPLIPLGSAFLTKEEWGSNEGISVAFSLKSVFMAWFRTFLFFSALGLLAAEFDCLVRLSESLPAVLLKGNRARATLEQVGIGLGGGICAALSFIGVLITYWIAGRVFGKASAERRNELEMMVKFRDLGPPPE